MHNEIATESSQNVTITNIINQQDAGSRISSSGPRGTEIQVWPPWGLDRIDNAYNGLDFVYKYKYDGEGVDIYIVDSGIALKTEDLDNRASCELNLVEDEGCEDGRNHGTKVAAVAAGWTFGVAKYASIKAIKIIDKRGNGKTSFALKALEHICDVKKQNPKKRIVVNMSLGLDRNSAVLDSAIEKTVELGIVVVVASGNENLDACTTSPSSSSSAISVAASDIEDKVWLDSNHGNCVDIVAYVIIHFRNQNFP